VTWSEGFTKRVSTIKGRYMSHITCAAYMTLFYHILSYFLGSILYHCISGGMLCMLLFNFVNYVFLLLYYAFLLLCMFRSRYSVSLCCSMYCLCVNVYWTTATGCQTNCFYLL
jgi:hypothetical protein